MNASRSTGSSAGSTTQASSRQRDDSSSAPLQPGLDDQDWGTSTKAAAGEAGEVASSLASSVKEAARTTTRAVREQASDFAGNVGHELGKTAEEQKMRGVEAIQGFVRAVNSAASELETQSPRVAGFVRDAAQKVESFSGNIGNRDVNDLVKAASELARSQPMLFFGGAVAAGFALSRFLKSSAKNHSGEDRSFQDGHSGQTGGSPGGAPYAASRAPGSSSSTGSSSVAGGSYGTTRASGSASGASGAYGSSSPSETGGGSVTGASRRST